MISRIAGLLSEWSNGVTAIADVPGKYQDLHLETVADLHPGLGPLGGLHTALSHARAGGQSDWIFVVSCDMTILSAQWLDILWKQAQGTTACYAILFEELTTDRLHPFPGCFHIEFLEVIEKQVTDGRLSLQELFRENEEKTKKLNLPDDWPEVPQINTKEDANRWLSSGL